MLTSKIFLLFSRKQAFNQRLKLLIQTNWTSAFSTEAYGIREVGSALKGPESFPGIERMAID